jgi:hypothetical protein
MVKKLGKFIFIFQYLLIFKFHIYYSKTDNVDTLAEVSLYGVVHGGQIYMHQ